MPGGVREVGWGLQPPGASTEPDEVVQMALGQLREYFAGQRRVLRRAASRVHLASRPTPIKPVSEAVLTLRELAEPGGTGVPARAIGEIMAATPVPIIMPCRRRSPAMESVDIPAASLVGMWRLSAGCWRTKAPLPPGLV